ncbi:hypothetical protein JRQ81_008884 [Phrynocephalus forsythii]|uniref:SHH signaling and ciliogenesis regulator SDCCAG8 n=1 Tax=Phrynocephalus forsythii TaxID=171643 RepID=A0A9Q0Y5C0_9SAUR|nr:hypothetical protein JRQ81_008884 [Phrynocephalus forsythii]
MEASPEPAGAAERVAACSPRSDWSGLPLARSRRGEEAQQGEAGLEESLERYHQTLRDRASESLSQLKHTLDENDLATGENVDMFEQLFLQTSHEENEDRAWKKLQYSHAVNQLKALLRTQQEKESETSPSRRMTTSPTRMAKSTDQDLPTLCDLIPIINDQSQYINHLEAEVKFCKEEMSELKTRIQVVVLENEKLHDDLKRLTTEHMLGDQNFPDNSAIPQNARATGGDYSQAWNTAKLSFHINEKASVDALEKEKWQQELEKLKYLHQEKTEALEAQVQFLRLVSY